MNALPTAALRAEPPKPVELLTACFGEQDVPDPDARFVPEGNGEALGHASVYVRNVRDENGVEFPVGWITHVCSSPAFRGKQAASAAVLSAHRWLRDEGLDFSALHTAIPKFFERFEYVVAPNMPGPGVAMVCSLTGRPWRPFQIVYREPW